MRSAKTGKVQAMATQTKVKTESAGMMVGEAIIPRYAMRAAHAIGATPAKLGGPVGKYLYDIDLANGALAAMKAVEFERICAALDDICILASSAGPIPDVEWDAAISAGIDVLSKVRDQ